MTASDNRRKYARLDLALSVSYAVQGASETIKNLRETLSSDISAGGLRLMTPTPLDVGAQLDLEITLEGHEGEPIRATGEVVWQNKISNTSFETGVTINSMPENDRSRFMQFVFDQMTKIVTPAAQ